MHIYMQNSYWRNNDKDKRKLLKKIYTSHFICKVLCVWEGVGDRTELQYIDPTPMAISVVSFLFSWCSTGGRGTQLSAECWLSLSHLVTNGSRNSIGVPEGPFGWVVAFPTTPCLQLVWSPTPDFLSHRVIYSSIAHSIFGMHVWSSSSRNSRHAVHRSLSSGASVYEYTIGFLPCPIFPASPPTRFHLITAIGMCHFLPVHHFGVACLAG